MTTRQATPTTTEMRRCAGSARFGIESHQAPVSEFPKQPSRKDGLGTMCTEHWRMYVKGLREARIAASPPTLPDEGAAIGAAVDAAIAREAAKGRARRKAATAKRPPRPRDTAIEQAEALIAEADVLPGPEHVERVGDGDVQAALEMVNGAPVEREVSKAELDSGTEEADAA